MLMQIRIFICNGISCSPVILGKNLSSSFEVYLSVPLGENLTVVTDEDDLSAFIEDTPLGLPLDLCIEYTRGNTSV